LRAFRARARLVSATIVTVQDLPTGGDMAAASDVRGGRGLPRRLEVLLALSASDLRARYGRGPWRLIKWLVDPFALVGVYLLLVTFVLDRPGRAPGLSLACAVIPFQLVMMAVVNALGAVQLRGSIILNMAFERVLIPVSSTLTETIAFGASLILLALMMASYGIAPTLAIVWLPIVLAVNVALAVACAYLASLLGLWFPDLRPFVVSFMRALFFLAPGLVPLTNIGGRASDLLRLNPLSGLFESYRATLLYGHRPAAWQLLYPVLFAAVVLFALLPVYRREQQQFAKVVE
jgi:lipopolysaccharide transport system permease protein